MERIVIGSDFTFDAVPGATKREQPTPARPARRAAAADVVDTVIAEAGGEGREGMQAVANVIKNRAAKRGQTPEDVVRAPHQFSGYGKKIDPNQRAEAQQIVSGVMDGQLPDNTGGADHFHSGAAPDWAGKMPKTAQIGGHAFYAEDGGQLGIDRQTTGSVPRKERPFKANWATVDRMGDPRSPEWQQKNLVTITPVKGQSWTVYKPAAAAFEGLIKDLEAEGYPVSSSGGFNYRNIRGSDKLSQHAFGTAIDINAADNPMMKGRLKTNLPANIREIAAKHGLKWGGDFKKRPDPMHFEYVGEGGVDDMTTASVKGEGGMERIVVNADYKPDPDTMGDIPGVRNFDPAAAYRKPQTDIDTTQATPEDPFAQVNADRASKGLKPLIAMPATKYDKWKEKFDADQPGVMSDIGESLRTGYWGLAGTMRELVHQIPGVGPTVVEKLDAIDAWMHGGESSQALIARKQSEAQQALSAPAKAAKAKNWVSETTNKDGSTSYGMGEAWSDPRSYMTAGFESLPATALTMVPGGYLAWAARAEALAAGATAEAAAAIAARTATIAGSVGEGFVGGAQNAQQTRDELSKVPIETWRQSKAFQSLVQGGMSEAEAQQAITDNASHQSFLIAGVVDGAFGGLGDRVLAKIVAEGVGGNVVKRMMRGVLREAPAEAAEEAAQSAGEQVGQNVAVQPVEKRPLLQGVGEAAAGGAAVGGAMGAAIGGPAGAVSPAGEEEAAPPPKPPPPAAKGAAAGANLPIAPTGPLEGAVLHGEVEQHRANEQTARANAGKTPPGAPPIGSKVSVTAGKQTFEATVSDYDPATGDAFVVDPETGEELQVPVADLAVQKPATDLVAKRDADGNIVYTPEPGDVPAPVEPGPTDAPPAEQKGSETTSKLPPPEAQKPVLERFPGPPEPGKSVIVDMPGVIERTPAKVESYEGGEALVRLPDGSGLQVPLANLYVDKRTKAEVAAAEEPKPVARPKPEGGTIRQVMSPKGEARNIEFPDDLHARLYDVGQQRTQAKRLGGTSQLDLDQVNPTEQQAIADELKISLQDAGQLADDYRYHAQRHAGTARSDLPQKMYKYPEKRLQRAQREFAAAQKAAQETSAEKPPAGEGAAAAVASPATAAPADLEKWWDTELDDVHRKKLLADAGIKRSSKTLWKNFPIDLKSKIAGVKPSSIDVAANEAATSPQNDLPDPTEAQIDAGNYKKGHPLPLAGIRVSIENPEGSTRSSKPGEPKWSRMMDYAHYGQILGTKGADGELVDIFIKPGTEGDVIDNDTPAWVIDQKNPADNMFDEHKVMVGYDSEADAREGYLANYPKGWKGLGAITQTTLGGVKDFFDVGRPNVPASIEPFSLDVDGQLPAGLLTQHDEGPAAEHIPFVPNKSEIKDAYGAGPIFPTPKGQPVDPAPKGTTLISQDEADARKERWQAIAQQIGDAKILARDGSYGKRAIISLFDASGEWSKPWLEAGYFVYQLDTQLDEGTGEDIFRISPEAILQHIEEKTGGRDIAGVLAATPCTTFAASGARWWESRHDVPDHDMVVKLFGPIAAKYFDTPVEANAWMVHITAAIMDAAKPGFHVLENPIGRIGEMSGLPKPTMRFDPADFGDPYTKRTQLWGVFDTDLPIAPVHPAEGSKMQAKLRGDRPEDKIARSTTPEGFAYSFFIANEPTAKAMWEAESKAAALQRGPYPNEGKTPAGEHAKAYVVAQGKKTGNEWTVAFDGQGRTRLHQEGTPTNSLVPPEFYPALLDKDADLVVHHNHPRSTTISTGDALHLILPGLSGLWAHGHDGTSSHVQLSDYAAKKLKVRRAAITAPDDALWLRDIFRDRLAPPIDAATDALVRARVISSAEGNILGPLMKMAALDRANFADWMTDIPIPDSWERPEIQQAIEKAAHDTAQALYRSLDHIRDGRRAVFVRSAGGVAGVLAGGRGRAGRRPAEGVLPGRGEASAGRPQGNAGLPGEPSKVAVTLSAEGAAAKARLLAKLGKKPPPEGLQEPDAIDPEILTDGITYAHDLINSGAVTFDEFARTLLADFGEIGRPYLKLWYMGVKFDPRQRHAGLTSAADVEAADVDAINFEPETQREPAPQPEPKKEPKPQPGQYGTPDAPDEQALGKAFGAYLANSYNRFDTIVQARKFAEERLGGPVKPGTPGAKAVDEAVELGVVLAARDIVAEGRRNKSTDATIFDRLLDLYNRQPNLAVRTSTSIENQAYSTPAPLAFVASNLAEITYTTSVLEPTAGNGMLLIEANPQRVTANELDPARHKNLMAQGFRASTKDAATAQLRHAGYPVDVVIANPPFGVVREGDGTSKSFQITDRYATNEIDHAISLNSLQSMRDDGSAVLLIAGPNKLASTKEARSDAYNGKAKRQFYYHLYNGYNVVDHFTVAGELYAKQGAGWPIDVIVIRGKGKSARALPAVDVPRQLSTWDEVKGALDANYSRPAAATGKPAGEPAVRTPEGRPAGGDAGPRGPVQDGGPAAAGVEPQQPAGAQPAVPGTDLGQRGTVGPDSELAGGPDAGAASEDAGEPDGAPDLAVKAPAAPVDTTERQIPYHPKSGHANLNTLVPVNMKTSSQEALEALEKRVGNVDTYVAKELGYKKDELGKYFGAEQIDGIALAIDNIKRGAGLIIGDQTGIGKGRQVAAVLKWARKNGKVPIFVTEMPPLYADMVRDLDDIGVKDPQIFMTNTNEKIPVDEEQTQFIRSLPKAAQNEAMGKMARTGKLSGHDYVFTTYSQMQTVKGKETERMQFLRALAPNAVIIFDESHNAGGTEEGQRAKKKGAPPNRAEFARELVKLASGVLYSSATYAKRPSVMDLYSKTDMRLAVPDLSKLGETISKGGVPMQQVVAAMLSRAGQYLRRERSFEGVQYNTSIADVDRDVYANFSESIHKIQVLSEKHVKPAVKDISEGLKGSAGAVSADGSTGAAGAQSSNFTSVLHNLISQMLLAIKADTAADMAINAAKAGEKPIITVSNTMESFISQVSDDLGLKPGDATNINFRDLLLRYLERSRMITIKDADGITEQHYLTDDELGPAGTAYYERAKDYIENSDFGNLPASPIDWMRHRLKAAGLRVGEITGRELTIDYRSDGQGVLRKRPDAEKSNRGKIKARLDFNNGNLDVLILNRSGATGVSLHANAKFKDRRQRHMIIAQAEGNIDTHMQMLGRVHRTGQVITPIYSQLVADVPAEKRPAAVLAKKMASLNANTTASRGSALTAKDVPDFMNEFGDQVAASVMFDNQELFARMGSPLKFGTDGYETEDAMRKLTGRIPLLKLPQQEELYDVLESEYTALITQLEAAGLNTLEAKTLPLAAKTLERTQVKEPSDASNSPFADGVWVDKANVNLLGKPMSSAEVLDEVVAALSRAGAPATIAQDAEGDPVAAYRRLKQAGFKVMGEIEKKAHSDFAVYRQQALDELSDDTRAAAETRLNDNQVKWDALADVLTPGAGVKVMTADGNLYGIVLEVSKTGKTKNPLAMGAWKARLAMADASRELTLPFSQLYTEQTAPTDPSPRAAQVGNVDGIGQLPMLTTFDDMQVAKRGDRYIVTGNLLSGYEYGNNKGSIINYTDDQGQVRQGILMPKDFNLAKHQAAKPVRFTTGDQVWSFLKQTTSIVTSTDRAASLAMVGNVTYGDLRVSTPSSKSQGGIYFLNQGVRDAAGQDFVSSGGLMQMKVDRPRAPAVIDALMKAGAVFETNSYKDVAKAIVDKPIVAGGMLEGGGLQEEPAPVPKSKEKYPSENSFVAAIKSGLTRLQPHALGAVYLNYFPELAQANMTSVAGYLKIKRKMDAYRGKKHADMDAVAQEWSRYARLGRKKAEELADLMHDATIAGVDPDSLEEKVVNDPAYPELRARFLAMAPMGQDVYRKVRDAYANQADEQDQILLDNFAKAQGISQRQARRALEEELKRISKKRGLSDAEKQHEARQVSEKYDVAAVRGRMAANARVTRLRIALESNRVKAPYFPLGRFGRYFVAVRDDEGNLEAWAQRETPRARDALAREYKEKYPASDVATGLLNDQEGSPVQAGVAKPQFIADIESMLPEGDTDANRRFMDQIWQRYLRSLPELSTRKKAIHRTKVPGFDRDALRVFASHMFHSAHQMARLKHGLDLNDMVDKVKEEGQAAKDPTKGTMLANELVKRHKWVMNPTGGKAAQVGSSLAFTYFLAASPAAALINTMQTPMVGIPMLGARFGGVSKAAAAILRASRNVFGNSGLSEAEISAMKKFEEIGLIDRTQSHDIAGVGETGVEYSPTRQRVMAAMSFMFHKAEVANRRVTALAAYRLARAEGKTDDQAIDMAADATWRVHFDYSNSSRPRWLQSDTAKVMLALRSYNINMLYRLGRDLHQMFKGATPAQRKEARTQFAAMIAMQALFAGATGVAGYNTAFMLYGIASTIASALTGGGGDDDPFEMETKFRQAVMDLLGPQLGGLALNGVPGTYLGVDLTSRVGMADLWFRSPNKDLQDGQDRYYYLLDQVAGAPFSVLKQILDGYDALAADKPLKAFEKVSPKVLKDLTKMGEYAYQGLTNWNGDSVVKPDDINYWDLIAQGAGFTPARIAEAWDTNSTLKNAEKRVKDRRQGVINSYALSFKMGDDDGVADALAEIRRYNQSPFGRTMPITGQTLQRSLKARAAIAEKRARGGGVLIQNEALGQKLREELPATVDE